MVKRRPKDRLAPRDLADRTVRIIPTACGPVDMEMVCSAEIEASEAVR